MTKVKFKPLLAATLPHDQIEEKLTFPVMISPKLDGVRVIIMDGVVVTRSLKPLPNEYIQSILGKPSLNGLDGEIIVGDSNHPDAFQHTSGAVRRKDGEPDFMFNVFDNYLIGGGFYDRHMSLARREPSCTLKEGILLKLLRHSTDEAEVIDFQERMHNANEAKVNALGRTERSSHKENKTGRGDLGAFLVKDLKSGTVFNVGTGFSDEQRQNYWDDRENIKGQIIRYKHKGHGALEAPRHPVFEGFRMKEDM